MAEADARRRADLTRRFGGLAAVQRRRARARARQAARGARPERRRQDDADQPAVGRPRAAAPARIRYKGADITGLPPDRRSRSSASAAATRRPTSSRRSPRSRTAGSPRSRARRASLHLCADAARTWPVATRRERALDAAGLDERASASPSALSHGEQRQLEIAMVLATAPEVLLLDEPLAGMGAEEARAHGRAAAASSRREHAILLVEHDMDAVFAVADVITVMVNGQVLESGAPDADPRAAPRCRQAYLGARSDGAMSESLLEARELHTYYGASHVLHGIDFRDRPRRDGRADGPQRHGQEHADPQHARADRRRAQRRGASSRARR